MTDKIKVLFLDFDGVLNSKTHYTKDENGILGLSPFHVNILNKIIERTNLKIVLSTSWRLENINDPCENCIKELKKAGFMYEKNIIGATKDLSIKKSKFVRGYEIEDFLINHPEIEDYIILDDVDDFLENQKKHLILVDPKIGLDIGILKKITKYLEENK